MTTKEIKKILIDRELTLAGIARQLEPDASETRSRSLSQMLSDLVYGRRWYPSLAHRLESEFNIKIVRPRAYEPKVRLKGEAVK